jgi:hypothetical protein
LLDVAVPTTHRVAIERTLDEAVELGTTYHLALVRIMPEATGSTPVLPRMRLLLGPVLERG